MPRKGPRTRSTFPIERLTLGWVYVLVHLRVTVGKLMLEMAILCTFPRSLRLGDFCSDNGNNLKFVVSSLQLYVSYVT